MKKIALAAAAALFIVGCAATPAPTDPPQGILVVPTATPTVEPTVEPTEDIPTIEPEPTLEPDPTVEPVDIVPLGTAAKVGDWKITVGKPNFDAWAKVKAENQFNDKPPKGMVDVLIPIRAVYEGTERTNLNPMARSFVLGEGTNVERQSFEDPTCGVVPKDVALTDPTVRKGGKVSGNLCFVVDKSDVATLVLLWSDDPYGFDGEFVTFALR